jgi:hypothetical protein
LSGSVRWLLQCFIAACVDALEKSSVAKKWAALEPFKSEQ